MVSVRIGNDTRPLADADAGWVNEQIDRRHRDGAAICVEVRIQTAGLDIRLSTPGCGGGGGGGRQPTSSERDIIELWEKRGLTTTDFTGGNVVAFLKQLAKLV